MVATLAGACGSLAPLPALPDESEYPMRVAIDPATASAGTAVAVRLANDGTVKLFFNLCFTGFFERLTEGGWLQVPQEDPPCPLISWQLDPGTEIMAAKTLPARAPTGTYRLRVELSPGPLKPMIVRRSNLFEAGWTSP